MTNFKNSETETLVVRRMLPSRLNSKQVGEVLGFAEHDIPILARKGLLRPLGRPVANATKYYATVQVESLGENQDWLHKATKAVSDYWREKNDRKETGGDDASVALDAQR